MNGSQNCDEPQGHTCRPRRYPRCYPRASTHPRCYPRLGGAVVTEASGKMMFPISHNLPLSASIWIKRWREAPRESASCRGLEAFRLGAGARLCGSLVRSRMLLDALTSPRTLRWRDLRRRCRCTSLARAAAVATASHDCATSRAGIMVERPRDACLQAVRPNPRNCFRRC